MIFGKKRDYLSEFETSLIGMTCSLRNREGQWFIEFDGPASIALAVPWRIVAEGSIALGSEDDGQMFGLPEPLDGENEARRLLDGKRIVRVLVDRQTADLTLTFDPDTRLDVINNSSGYEGWEADCQVDSQSMKFIALGGGSVEVYA
jgi:hypothetical protein